jgi:type I restriction enzyme, R subunit
MKITEADTRADYIDPVLKEVWTKNGGTIHREHYFTDGRKLLGNKRGERCFADYLLAYKNLPLALIEAKALGKPPTEGLQQAIDYAKKLRLKYLYSTNGRKIYEFNMDTGKGKYVDTYPTPQELYSRILGQNLDSKSSLLEQPYHLTGSMKPRYYQENAINAVMEAIGEGEKRILLTMATGTGKTFISFQIVHKVFQAKWNLDGGNKRRPKILFLADRNILADQAINTFNPYENDLIKINGEEIKSRNGKVPTNAHIFFAIYQAIAEKENLGGYYQEYPKDFFDLIVIDECHRGSANEEGSWRAILDHFGCAVHLGMTATPKRKDNIDTYKYFGDSVYEYSLKEGINDGFLSPYKVKRVRTNIDEYIYSSGDKVISGEVEERPYQIKEFNRKIILPQRTELIAKTILKMMKPLEKTIIFCVNQEHALSVRDYINTHKSIKDPNYCVRVTSDEGKLGRELLEKFQDNDKDIPTILTSSLMLTTGVDARNVRNIVLMRQMNSVVEFKQIVGRGTRLFEGKDFFTIIDFTGASNLFYDPDWEGPPEEVPEEIEVEDTYDDPEEDTDGGDIEVGEDEGEYIADPPESSDGPEPLAPPTAPIEKIEIQLSNSRKLRVIDIETRYVGADGKPLTATEFLESLIGQLPSLYETEEELRKLWANPESRKVVMSKLEAVGFDDEHLQTLKEMFGAIDSDIFDVLSHISFSADLMTRTQRAVQTKNESHIFEVYDNFKAKEFLYFLLSCYEKNGIKELERDKLSNLIKLNKLGTTKEAAALFGGPKELVGAFLKLQQEIYNAS